MAQALNFPISKLSPSPLDPSWLSNKVRKEVVSTTQRHRGNSILLGQTPRPSAVQLRSNDYLCLSAEQRIMDAEIEVLKAQGHGDAISRIFVNRREDAHRRFEKHIARLMQAEDAVLTMSGYCANVGLIQAITPPETPVYIDRMAHASLWEGIKSAHATPRVFRHNSAENLETQIKQFGPGLVIVDAVYSTNGDVCPLQDIVEVSERGGCAIIVDETHSFGAQGPHGAGLVSALGLSHRVHFRTVGLSKAVASRGGVVVGSAQNMDFIRYEALPMIFSTSVLAHEAAGYEAALDIIENEEWRRVLLHKNHAYLRVGLEELGYNVEDSKTQIIALEAGAETDVMRLRDALESRDVFGSVFCAPATAKNRAIIRLTINCGLTQDQLEHVLNVCRDIREELDVAHWPSTLRKSHTSSADEEFKTRYKRLRQSVRPLIRGGTSPSGAGLHH